jgi:predicted nucleotidyltransferase
MNTIDSLHVVARYFNGLDIPYAFLGASVLPLLVDNPAVQEIRPTIDIDLSVQVVTLSALYELEERLRALGFRHDTREGAPICRWLVDGITVDVMPTEAAVLGMASEWFHEAVKTATKMDLGEVVHAPVITRPCFLATKLTAYRDRGAKDPYMSKDLEDIVTLFDGCRERDFLFGNGSSSLRNFIVSGMQAHLEDPEFVEAVEGCFRGDPVSRERSQIVLARMRSIATGRS